MKMIIYISQNPNKKRSSKRRKENTSSSSSTHDMEVYAPEKNNEKLLCVQWSKPREAFIIILNLIAALSGWIARLCSQKSFSFSFRNKEIEC